MPNIIFSNPNYKDKTVYAVAGSFTETILKIAKTHKIPIDFSCGDGECGTCAIQVRYLGDTPPGLLPGGKRKAGAARVGEDQRRGTRAHGRK
uniref:Ferredoxin n=1 Tax=Candidatus Kentrum sp. FW TaxID=2126338 RepID=A0A450T5M3_9GAMM|nr:MAG: Ferredoxin [Candidatus Kentron sp. FW]